MAIRIYVQNLASYNNGNLGRGEWIDLPADADTLQATLDRISGATENTCGDELAIHAHEAPFKINEYDAIAELNTIAERLEAIDEYLFAAIEDATGYDASQILDIMEEGSYQAYHDVDGMEDVAADMVAGGLYGEIPAPLVNYIDYEAIGRDLGYDGWSYHRDTRIAVCMG